MAILLPIEGTRQLASNVFVQCGAEASMNGKSISEFSMAT